MKTDANESKRFFEIWCLTIPIVHLLMMPLAFLTSTPLCAFYSERRTRSSRSTRIAISAIHLSSAIDAHVVPILADNLSYLLHDKGNKTAAVIDPAEPNKLLFVARNLDSRITTAVTTHHNLDHACGNSELASLVPVITTIGSAYETADDVNSPMHTGEILNVKNITFSIKDLHTPCHTQCHLCILTNTTRKAVLTGDTLFIADCGKFFGGDAGDMDTSLNSVLGSLEGETLVFCAHEYTITNLLFAASIDSENSAVTEKLQWAKSRVKEGLPTVLSSIADEKRYKPFMRTSVPAIAPAIGANIGDPETITKLLRERKNAFRP